MSSIQIEKIVIPCDITQVEFSRGTPRVNAKYYNPRDFQDVAHIATAENLDAIDDNGNRLFTLMAISRYCENLIRSGETSRQVLYKHFLKADLCYKNPLTGDNLLNIAILSNNFTAIDNLLLLKCPKNVKNDRGFSAEDFVSFDSCHKTIKFIFKKYSTDSVEQAAEVKIIANELP